MQRLGAPKDPASTVLRVISVRPAADSGECAEEPVPPSLPYRAAPEGIVGFEVLDGAGNDLAVGYEEYGEARGHRRDGSGCSIWLRLGRESWERRRDADA